MRARIVSRASLSLRAILSIGRIAASARLWNAERRWWSLAGVLDRVGSVLIISGAVRELERLALELVELRENERLNEELRRRKATV